MSVIQQRTNGTGKANLSSTPSNYDIYYVPFVRDSQYYVNAAMAIRVSPTDTSFNYLCDWQYSQLDNQENNLKDKSESFALFFMIMDKTVFGYNKFRLTDKNLFKKSGQSPVYVSLKTQASSSAVTTNVINVNYCMDVLISFQNGTCWYLANGFSCSSSGGCDYCNKPDGRCPPTTTTSLTFCWTELEEEGGGGSYGGGSGGGGEGGGTGGDGTPPPCGGQAPTSTRVEQTQGSRVIGLNIQQGGCGGGWEPIEDVDIEGYEFSPADQSALDDLNAKEAALGDYYDIPKPCYGTKKLPGSVFLQTQATVAHLMIQEAYIRSQPLGVAEYSIPGSSSTGSGRRGYADLVNLGTGEIFEIKPPTEFLTGAAEVNVYVEKATANCPPLSASTTWKQGITFTPMDLPYPLDPTMVLHAELVAGTGVILYDLRPRATNPISIPMPQSVEDVVKELMKRRRDYPSKVFPEIALAYLRKLQETPAGRALVKNLKSAVLTTAYSILLGYVAQAVFTEGAGLILGAEALLLAEELIEVAIIL